MFDEMIAAAEGGNFALPDCGLLEAESASLLLNRMLLIAACARLESINPLGHVF
jgi:hypothetical protein